MKNIFIETYGLHYCCTANAGTNPRLKILQKKLELINSFIYSKHCKLQNKVTNFGTNQSDFEFIEIFKIFQYDVFVIDIASSYLW